MKIGIAQISCTPGEVTLNCSQLPVLTRQAKEQGCEVIVFPELMDTGYDMSIIQNAASSWKDSPFLTAGQAAQDNSVYLMCGLSEREGNRIYNSIAVFNPEGSLIGKYRKTHLFGFDPVNENKYFTAGDSLETVQIGDMTWGLLICYDLRFPELSRSLVRKGAEVLVMCSAWPFPRQSHFKTLTEARAIENQSYVIAVNRVGTDGPLTFCGSSRIINPDGTIAVSAPEEQSELLTGEIIPDSIRSLRSSMPVLEDLRKDLF